MNKNVVVWVYPETREKLKRAAEYEGVSLTKFMKKMGDYVGSDGGRRWVYLDEEDYEDLRDLAIAWGCDIDTAFKNVLNAVRIAFSDEEISEPLTRIIQKIHQK